MKVITMCIFVNYFCKNTEHKIHSLSSGMWSYAKYVITMLSYFIKLETDPAYCLVLIGPDCHKQFLESDARPLGTFGIKHIFKQYDSLKTLLAKHYIKLDQRVVVLEMAPRPNCREDQFYPVTFKFPLIGEENKTVRGAGIQKQVNDKCLPSPKGQNLRSSDTRQALQAGSLGTQRRTTPATEDHCAPGSVVFHSVFLTVPPCRQKGCRPEPLSSGKG